MHVRFSTVQGLPVVEEGTEEQIAALSGMLINPDLGKIEGFFVSVQGFMNSTELFLAVADIMHWGNRVRVRDADVLSPLHELVRLEALEREGRTVLNQKITTEDGRILGMCRDVQFDTKGFYLEWIFPRRFWRWGTALPVSSIVIVRPDAIVVRNNITLPEPAAANSMLKALDPMTSPATQRVAQRRRE